MSAGLRCGCCAPGGPATPQPHFNRPGLPRISYRCGTFAGFRQAMIEETARRPELRNWTARSPDDLGVALLECWAYLADVLTFYTERAANESLLRTAGLRESVLRLAALVGYRPMPGLAAIAQLAFELDPGAQLELPAGLRVKSVPGQGEKAVTFETGEALSADATLNAAPARGEPKMLDPWEPPDGSADGGAVEPPFAEDARRAFSVGTEFLLFSEQAVVAEEKTVTSLEQRPPVVDLRFDPPTVSPDLALAESEPTLSRFGRRFRLFGHDAPPAWTRQVMNTEGKLEFQEVAAAGYDLLVPAGKQLPLDRVADGLQAGMEVVVASAPLVAHCTIEMVETSAKKLGPLGSTVTVLTLDRELWQASDSGRPTVREVTVYELRPPSIALWQMDFPARIDGARVLVPLPVESPAIQPGRKVILDDAAQEPIPRTVVAVSGYTSYGDGPPDHLLLDLDSELPRELDAATAVVRGNVAPASHGETVAAERLGVGDASIAFQRLALAKAPLTRVPRAGAPHGAAAELEVRVAGMLWHETQEFVGRRAGDRVYEVETADDGTTTVLFGDGETGFRPPTGAEIVARYRQGLGMEGRVRSGQLTSLLDRPKGLSAVTNPLPSEGAAEPETLEQARENVPAAVRTLGRVVSLRDFEDAARESALVAKARAKVARGADETGVLLTVAGAEGQHLGPDALRALREDLDARRDQYRRLEIADYVEVPLLIEATVIARDPDRLPEEVEKAARKALLDELAFERRELGQPLHSSDVLASLQSAAGVVGVDLDVLRYREDADRVAHSMPEEDVLAHLPIGAGELTTLAPADLVVKVP